MTDRLEQAVRRFRRGAETGVAEPTELRISAAAFRASVEERLKGLEQDVGELRGRINGLIFVVIGAVVTQLLLRLAE